MENIWKRVYINTQYKNGRFWAAKWLSSKLFTLLSCPLLKFTTILHQCVAKRVLLGSFFRLYWFTLCYGVTSVSKRCNKNGFPSGIDYSTFPSFLHLRYLSQLQNIQNFNITNLYNFSTVLNLLCWVTFLNFPAYSKQD